MAGGHPSSFLALIAPVQLAAVVLWTLAARTLAADLRTSLLPVAWPLAGPLLSAGG